MRAGAFSLGGLGLASLLKQDRLLAEPVKPFLPGEHFDLSQKKPHHDPKAKAVISLFMKENGTGCSSAGCICN